MLTIDVKQVLNQFCFVMLIPILSGELFPN